VYGYTAPGQALTDLILEVFRFNGRLLAAGDRLTRPVGQTSARWQVLGALDGGPASVSQIARAMGLTRQSVQRTADRLHADGVVAYADNPAHRRAKLVMLTAEGRSALDRITRRYADWVNALAAGVSPSELRRALATLRAVRETLEDPGGLMRSQAFSPRSSSRPSCSPRSSWKRSEATRPSRA
jgi:DNA-binding MarR family transcriptional regulator